MATNNNVKLSKALSWLLRHGAEQKGVSMDSAGYVSMNDILRLPEFRRYTIKDIQDVVASCRKQRFQTTTRPEDGQLLIRATQGHTLSSVDQHQLLTPVHDASQFPVAVHGTTLDAWEKIRASGGLSRMKRQHIHIATGLPGADGVRSGMRSSSQVMIYIDLPTALAAGVPFFVSTNNVLLTPGVGDTGLLPLKYVSRVTFVPSKSSPPQQLYP